MHSLLIIQRRGAIALLQVPVIPTEVGIHPAATPLTWIPVFTGMTDYQQQNRNFENF
jgi:hypothetical protein